jgi:hypothetical protein
LASMPLHATPMATPPAANSAAKLVVSTPKKHVLLRRRPSPVRVGSGGLQGRRPSTVRARPFLSHVRRRRQEPRRRWRRQHPYRGPFVDRPEWGW